MNRMDFFVGFIALCLGGALLMTMAAWLIASITRQPMMAGLTHPGPGIGMMLVIVPFVLGLLAARAHDLNWPAWPFAALYLIPILPFVLTRALPDHLRTVLARAIPEDLGGLILFGPVVLFWIAFAALATRKGQPTPNRFGPQT